MNPLFSLHGKVILVTGASSGIGQSVAAMLSQLGASVIFTGRDHDRLEATRGLLTGEGHRAVLADLADESVRRQLVQELPSLDGVVFCAGFNKIKPSKFMDEATVRETMTINFDSPYLMTCSMLKQRKIKDGGSVVYIGSIASDFAMPGNGIYSASKAALISVAKVLAVEVAKTKIRVNVISPGQVITPMTVRTSQHISPEALTENEAQYPLGFGRPEDIASAVSYLLSDGARWITGQNIIFDGGFTLK